MPRRVNEDTSIRVLRFYRAWLIRIIDVAERRTPVAARDASRATADLVERLNSDLLSLYRRRESGTLAIGEQTVLVPTLERIRNVLRFRTSRKRSIEDTLRQAVTQLSQTLL